MLVTMDTYARRVLLRFGDGPISEMAQEWTGGREQGNGPLESFGLQVELFLFFYSFFSISKFKVPN
jgi:hypothetical protein